MTDVVTKMADVFNDFLFLTWNGPDLSRDIKDLCLMRD